MHRVLPILTLSIFIVVHSAVAQETMAITIPIFSQKVSFDIEKSWKPGWQSPKNPGSYTMELIPGNETVQSWTKMVTVSGFKDFAKKFSIEEAYKLEADSVAKACPKEFVNKMIPVKNPQGYESVSAIIGCSKHPQLKDRNEVGFYTFVKGKSDVYMLKKSFHEDLTNKKSAKLDEGNYKTFAPEVLSLKICKNDGQSPSCVADPR